MPPSRVVVSDPGTDGPTRTAADAVARALRDAGLEVVRLRDAPTAAVAAVVLQEDAAAVLLAGASAAATAALEEALGAAGCGDVLVLAPGTAPGDVVAAVRAASAGWPGDQGVSRRTGSRGPR